MSYAAGTHEVPSGKFYCWKGNHRSTKDEQWVGAHRKAHDAAVGLA